MSFLNPDDYSAQIRAEILAIVKNNNGLAIAELAAQAEMESYLSGRYKVAEIFEATTDQRNPLIMLYLIDIALYHLHSNISPRNIPELRGIRYEAAIEWLKLVASGKINPDLPLRETEDVSYALSVGSNPKYSQGW